MGPLQGVKVLEIASIGPGPFAAMLLADMGAEVTRIEKLDTVRQTPESVSSPDVLLRGRKSIALDLKNEHGRDIFLRQVKEVDIVLEGFRSGVAERLGCGPDDCFSQNPKLVYGRMTGWGQSGPLATTAGHDITYIARSGALFPIGNEGSPPAIPLNLVGDFGGGGMFLAFGVMCALWEAQKSGKGQVVDAAMVDGSAVLTTMFHAFRAMGIWDDARGTNILDGGAPFYAVYETLDGKYVAIGPLEAKFYAILLERLGLQDNPIFADQYNKSTWPEMKKTFTELFLTKTRDDWVSLCDGTDACLAPVLSLEEAPLDKHNVQRDTFVTRDGIIQPAPAPRFSRTPPTLEQLPTFPGQQTKEILLSWGYTEDEYLHFMNQEIIR